MRWVIQRDNNEMKKEGTPMAMATRVSSLSVIFVSIAMLKRDAIVTTYGFL